MSHGLRAAWSEPLISKDGTVLGTFTMYCGEPRVPDTSDLEMIEAAGHIAGIAIQMERSQAALRESEEWLRLAIQAGKMYAYEWDITFDIEAARRNGGLGLTSMQERVRLVGGTLEIDSKPLSGTTIRVRVPYKVNQVQG